MASGSNTAVSSNRSYSDADVRAQGLREIEEGGARASLIGHCAGFVRDDDGIVDPFASILVDGSFTIRAWMAVVSFLALQPEFIQR